MMKREMKKVVAAKTSIGAKTRKLPGSISLVHDPLKNKVKHTKTK